MTVKPPGNPHGDASREKLTYVGFKADEETLAAIETLTKAAAAGGHKRAKSAAIRRAIIEAAARLSGGKAKK